MLSQKFIAKVAEGWSQPTLAELFQEWWYLIILALLIAIALLWTMIQLVKVDMAMRRADRAGQGTDGEEAAANAALFRARRQFIVRPMLLLLVILFFVAYPVLKSWYGLE